MGLILYLQFHYTRYKSTVTQWFMQQAGNSGPVASGHAPDICFSHELLRFTPMFYLVFHLLMNQRFQITFQVNRKKTELTQSYNYESYNKGSFYENRCNNTTSLNFYIALLLYYYFMKKFEQNPKCREQHRQSVFPSPRLSCHQPRANHPYPRHSPTV